MIFWNKKQRKTEKKEVPKTATTILEKWKDLAVPVLTDIIEKNGSKLEGFIFYKDSPASSISYSSGVTIYKIHANEEGTYSFSIGDRDYPEYLTLMPWKDTPERLAHEMFSGLETLYNPKKFLNKRRNQLVREIEERTGRNLKKEILNPTH